MGMVVKNCKDNPKPLLNMLQLVSEAPYKVLSLVRFEFELLGILIIFICYEDIITNQNLDKIEYLRDDTKIQIKLQ